MQFPPPHLEYVRAHLSWMLGRDGAGARIRYKFSRVPPAEMRARLQEASSLAQLQDLAQTCFGIEHPLVFRQRHRQCQEVEVEGCMAEVPLANQDLGAVVPVEVA